MSHAYDRWSETDMRGGRVFRGAGVLVLAGLLSGFNSLESLFAPKAELWERWAAHDDASAATVDHAPWQAVLDTHVSAGADGAARVAYGAMTEADAAALRGYVDRMSRVAVSKLNKAEQRAYWINLYNALTVQLVLGHYPVKSIRDIKVEDGLFKDGPWDAKLVTVEGEKLTLNDIEHRILRPIWKDPRLHYALNCASKGCPDLNRTAYTAANSELLLNESAVAFINHPRGVSAGEKGLVLSKIYLWFTDDFGGEAGVYEHLRTFALADLAASLEGSPGVSDFTYDWSLNE